MAAKGPVRKIQAVILQHWVLEAMYLQYQASEL